jgi:uncharacterized integral membrane protein
MQTQILKTKEERKDFLENDFLDRLVRIEQRVSAKFGKLIKYNDTYCYKNLTPANKKRYDAYLASKKKKKFAFAVGFLIILFGVLFISNGITGNVVKTNLGESSYNFITLILVSSLIGGLVAVTVFALILAKREKRFGPLFKPLENISKKKGL